MSKLARTAINAMLTVDPKRRPAAEEMCRHPWLAAADANAPATGALQASSLSASYLENMAATVRAAKRAREATHEGLRSGSYGHYSSFGSGSVLGSSLLGQSFGMHGASPAGSSAESSPTSAGIGFLPSSRLADPPRPQPSVLGQAVRQGERIGDRPPGAPHRSSHRSSDASRKQQGHHPLKMVRLQGGFERGHSEETMGGEPFAPASKCNQVQSATSHRGEPFAPASLAGFEISSKMKAQAEAAIYSLPAAAAPPRSPLRPAPEAQAAASTPTTAAALLMTVLEGFHAQHHRLPSVGEFVDAFRPHGALDEKTAARLLAAELQCRE